MLTQSSDRHAPAMPLEPGTTSVAFVKGHGTENDFLVLPDPDGDLDLTAEAVVALCDRRAGLGADGVLRVVRTAAVPEAATLSGVAEWFMDLRNADGSLAEMSGNGMRVFARYLASAGLVSGDEPARVATRGGVRQVRFDADGQITVGMGTAQLAPRDGRLAVHVGNRSWPATKVLMPNPHAVVIVDALEDAGPLDAAPPVTPADAFPEGVNVEFVVRSAPRQLALRVHERGVGETRSCGTGACAAAVTVHGRASTPDSYTVDVPGGRLAVTVHPDGQVELTGPAMLVAAGRVVLPSAAHAPAR